MKSEKCPFGVKETQLSLQDLKEMGRIQKEGQAIRERCWNCESRSIQGPGLQQFRSAWLAFFIQISWWSLKEEATLMLDPN